MLRFTNLYYYQFLPTREIRDSPTLAIFRAKIDEYIRNVVLIKVITYNISKWSIYLLFGSGVIIINF